MKQANNIQIRVFCKKHEDENQVMQGLKSILGFTDEELEKEKIEIKKTNAKGFEEKITIFESALEKDRHTNQFLKLLNDKLTKKDKELLLKQKNRLDENLNFFIRLSKPEILKAFYELTDSGECYHIKINIAAFPKNKKIALQRIKEMFS